MNCRLCLIECTNENTYFIFGCSEFMWTALAIHKYLHIKVEQNDSYSTVICKDCFTHIREFHSYYQNIEQRQNELQKIQTAEDQETDNIFLANIKTETYEDETITEFVEVKTDPFVESNGKEQNGENGSVHNEATFELCESRVNEDIDDNDKNRICIICNKLHKSYKALQSHMYKIHNDIKPFSCNNCALEFRFRPNLIRHLQERKCENKGAAANMEDIKERTCLYCRKVHKSIGGLHSHIYRTHNSDKPFTCNKCEVGFKYKQALKRHLAKKLCRKSSKHKAINAFDEIKDRTCAVCQKRCKTIDSLSSHMYQNHKGEKPFNCDSCGLSFRLRGTFLRHFWKCSGYSIAENVEPTASQNLETTIEIECRTCVLCKRVFDKVSTLFHHMCKEHKGVKPFSCQDCGKTFVLKQAFKNHFKRNCSSKKRNAALFDAD